MSTEYPGVAYAPLEKVPATPQNVEVGYAIRGFNGGYLDTNGVGDSSLAGTPLTCDVFSSYAGAAQAVAEDPAFFDEDCEIVAITRVAAAIVVERQAKR
jgi:hypothetical protein